MWVECDLDHRRPRSFLLKNGDGELGFFDLACAFAAVGNPPAAFEDVESGPVLVYRAPKMGQHAAKRMRSCDGRRRSVLAKSAPNLRHQCRLLSWVTRMLGSNTADDLGRRCERRLTAPQMCQLISMSSSDMRIGFPSANGEAFTGGRRF